MSPEQSIELFNLSAQGPLGDGIYGGALARAGAHAGASFRRGIDLSAGFDLAASVEASLHDAVEATVQAGVGARVGLALQAAMPLDLFTEAGLVARLQAQAEAAAYIKASVGLGFDFFRQLVHARLGEGPLVETLDAFLEEAIVEAGFWGRAAFAAEILGEATLTGSLLPHAKNGSGFSFTLQYAVGWIYGTGEQFVVNIGFKDPRRLIGRLSDLFASLLLREADKVIETLPQSERVAAEEAVPLLKLMVPLATRTAFEAGVRLAENAIDPASDTATASVVEAFGREAQDFLLDALFDFAVDALSDVFRGFQLVEAWIALDEQHREDVKTQLKALATALDELDQIDRSDVDRWLAVVLRCVTALGSMIDDGLVPFHSDRFFRDGMAYFFAAATVTQRLAEWFASPTDQRGPLFGESAVTVPDNSSIAAHIASQIQKPPGSALTMADLVRFLIGADPIDWLRRSSDVVAGGLDWLETLLQLKSDADLLEYLLTKLLPPDEAAVQSILQRMGDAFSTALQDQVLPDLIAPMKQHSGEAVGVFLDSVIVPTLAALPAVLLPRLAHLDDEEGIVRFREALSAVLLQTVSRLVLKTIDVLLAHALTEGHQALRAAGKDVEDLGESFPAFAEVAALASRAILPVTLTPRDLAALLRLAADATERWNDRHRETLFNSVETMFALGLADEVSRNRTFKTLTTSDQPALEDDLGTVLDHVKDSTLDMLGFMGPGILELVVMHYVNEVETVALAVYEGAKAVVAALEQGIAWLADEIDKLKKKVEELLGEAARLGAKIAGDIAALANYLTTLVSDIVDAVREAGWNLVDDVIPDWVPEWGVDIVRTVYDALFDAVKFLLNVPLSVLYVIASWVRDMLTAQANGSAINAATVKEQVKQKILAWQASGLTFKVEADLGFTTVTLSSVTLPAGDVLWAIVDVVLGDPTFDGTVTGCSQNTTTLQQVESQRIATQAVLDQQLDKAKAQNVVGNLTTGQPLQVRIITPEDRKAYKTETKVKIVVQGANRSFADPPLGVPRRITLRFNGREYQYPAETWSEDVDGLSFEATIPLPVPQISIEAPSQLIAVGAEPIAVSTWRIPSGTHVMKSGRPHLRYELGAPGTTGLVEAAPPVTVSAGISAARPQEGRAEWASQPEPHGSIVGRVISASVSAQPPPEGRTANAGAGPVTSGARSVIAPEGSLSVSDVHLSRARVILEEAFDSSNVAASPDALPVTTALVGQPGMNALQVAVSDGKQQTASASVVFFLGVQPATRAVEVSAVHANPPGRDVPGGERVVIRSLQDDPLGMTGWMLRDLARHEYTFPPFTLQPHSEVTVWTREGTDDEENLYWGRHAAVWNNPGDSAVLHDARGNEVSRLSYRPGTA